ncbi:Uncharacterised protein [Klebsiella grimontii]|uniref:Uncharacterized protein n=1 Tax=Klebsiella grimontii TaxID=2058152 RepID=A0A7H4P5A1_9ENTR|nr:Uncharacterised protein [Klebsiella grimontii]
MPLLMCHVEHVQGDHVLISCSGNVQFAIVRGRSLITTEGEAIEGEALDDVVVEGVVTFLINRAYHHDDDQNTCNLNLDPLWRVFFIYREKIKLNMSMGSEK